MTRHSLIAALALAALAGSASAQQQPPPSPPIRELGPVEVTSPEAFGTSVALRHTPRGLLVNDIQNRRLVLLDSALQLAKVVADSTPATATAYSGRMGGLIPYHGDSSLFVDPTSMSMLLIAPAGDVARVMSVPRSQDAMMLGTPMAGAPGFDAAGRLVYRGSPRIEMRRPARAAGSGAPAFTPPEFPDSTPVVRVDLVTRAVDTLGYVRIPRVKMEMSRDENGRVTMSATMNPLPVIDDWAVLSDGSVALLRGHDYHIDWIRPDGTRESSPRIPFDWRRLSDEDKVALIDSVKAQRERMQAEAPQDTVAAGRASGVRRGGGGQGPGGGLGGGVGGGGMQGARVMIQDGGPGGSNVQIVGPGGRGQIDFVAPEELPDYQPVFFANSVRADADGRLWVRTIPTRTREGGGGAVYDVISGKGELVDRVQVPAGRAIIGFGKGGIVYLAVIEGRTISLERASAP